MDLNFGRSGKETKVFKQQMWLKDEEEKVSTTLFFVKEDVEE